MTWDDDIARMKLSDGEKDGLQVYRNYSKAFRAHQLKEFSADIDKTGLDARPIGKVVHLAATEDVRSVPVIACAFADDQLVDMFKRELPKEIVGGSSAFFGPYGPSSNLFNRLQLASAFRLVAPDLLIDLDVVRRARNEISHNWDVDKVRWFAERGAVARMHEVNVFEFAGQSRIGEIYQASSPVLRFRIRVIWMLSRLYFECLYFYRAFKGQLDPVEALYGEHGPKCLGTVAQLATEGTNAAIEHEQSLSP